MKTTVETGRAVQPDAEITLGMRSVLGIFFGLVLVCGIFFGFGYSLGRGNNPAKGSAPVETTTLPASLGDSSGENIKTVVEAPTTHTVSALETVNSNAKAVAGISAPSKVLQPKPSAGSIVPSASKNAPQILPDKNSGSAVAPPSKMIAPNIATQPAAIMVQVAAVSRRQDADVLVSALSELGYSASVHTDSADRLLHVQIGPFTTSDGAKAMRAKLLNDGYNAILK